MKNDVIRVVESCKNINSTGAERLSMNIVKHIIESIIKPLIKHISTGFMYFVYMSTQEVFDWQTFYPE